MGRARHTPQIIGWIRNKPIYLIQGGAEDDDDNGDDLGDLGDDGDGDPDDDDKGGDTKPPAWWKDAAASLEQKVNSTIDRRINQLGRKNQGNQGGNAAGAGGSAEPKVDLGDVREARMVARSGLEGMRFSTGERELVAGLLTSTVTAKLRDTSDPDLAGTQTAEWIRTTVQNLRREHEQALLRRLDAAGALDRSKLPQNGQSNGGTKTPKTKGPSPEDQWNTGASLAQQMLAGRGVTLPKKQ